MAMSLTQYSLISETKGKKTKRDWKARRKTICGWSDSRIHQDNFASASVLARGRCHCYVLSLILKIKVWRVSFSINLLSLQTTILLDSSDFLLCRWYNLSSL